MTYRKQQAFLLGSIPSSSLLSLPIPSFHSRIHRRGVPLAEVVRFMYRRAGSSTSFLCAWPGDSSEPFNVSRWQVSVKKELPAGLNPEAPIIPSLTDLNATSSTPGMDRKPSEIRMSRMVHVAQLDRASASEAEGCRFDPCRGRWDEWCGGFRAHRA